MYGTNIEMTHNTFINNWGPASYGLLLKEIKDGKIHYNKFIKNTTAIYGEGALRMDIRNNTFEANGWAMKVLSSCMENTVIDNVFNSNSFSVFTNSPRNYNVFKNNYWSEYSGYDLDRDGFGDIPHRPVSLFTYIVEQCEPALLLMRSNFIGLLELAEKAAPAITPETLVDEQPRMKPQW
jgi:nitrous oxidase accessory protein